MDDETIARIADAVAIRVTERSVRLYTVREAADLLRVAEKAVRRAIASGDLRCFRAGRDTMLSLGHLEDWIHGRNTALGEIGTKLLDAIHSALKQRTETR